MLLYGSRIYKSMVCRPEHTSFAAATAAAVAAGVVACGGVLVTACNLAVKPTGGRH